MTRPDRIEEDVLIGPETTLEVGGAARYYAACDTVKQLRHILRWGRKKALPVFVLGGGSNIVFSDAGFDGLVVSYQRSRVRISATNDHYEVKAGAGTSWDELVQTCVAEKLAGIECLSGIPGLVGASPIQNIGAYGQEVATTVESVSGLDRVSLKKTRIPASGCGFGYRTSDFKTHRKSFIVTSVRFRLERKDAGLVEYDHLRRSLDLNAVSKARPTLAETRAAVLSVRRAKSMVISADDPNRRSVGSFFLNPVMSSGDCEKLVKNVQELDLDEKVPVFRLNDGRVKIPAAWLIEHAGYHRGTTEGRVGLSSRHALAVINRGGATANDIVEFAARIRLAVFRTFGVTLFPEPVFVGFDAEPEGLFSKNPA